MAEADAAVRNRSAVANDGRSRIRIAETKIKKYKIKTTHMTVWVVFYVSYKISSISKIKPSYLQPEQDEILFWKQYSYDILP